jgi:hypothetical protein
MIGIVDGSGGLTGFQEREREWAFSNQARHFSGIMNLVRQHSPGLTSPTPVNLYRVTLLPTNSRATIAPEFKLQLREHTKIATINLDNIQFYSPNPPLLKSRDTYEPLVSAGISTGNDYIYTLQFTFLAVSKASA